MRRVEFMGWAVLAAGLLAALATGCSRGGAEGEPAGGRRGMGPEAIPVAAVEVRPRDLTRTVTVTGPIEPLRTVSVGSQISGTVLRVLVEEGDRVTTGQLLAEFDARETSAQVERARAVLANAEATFQRAEQLRANNLTSEADFDAARSALGIARADAELWRTRLAFTRVVAPVSGVVTAKHVERGNTVSSNDSMFEIAEDSVLVVRVRVSELDVVSLRSGREATVHLDAYPGAVLSGRIRRIFPSADATSRLVPVEVQLGREPAGVRARPGFLARIDFELDQREGVLAVPAAAVGVQNGGAFVFVVDADTLVRKPVETGVTAAGWIEVTSGLESGEKVVSSGHMNLQSGARVRVAADTTVAERR